MDSSKLSGTWDFFRRTIAWIKQHPVATAWIVLVAGVIGGIGNLSDGEMGGGFTGLLFAAGAALWLCRHRVALVQAERARIAARADEQHQLFLQGDDRGTYGNFPIARELRTHVVSLDKEI